MRAFGKRSLDVVVLSVILAIIFAIYGFTKKPTIEPATRDQATKQQSAQGADAPDVGFSKIGAAAWQEWRMATADHQVIAAAVAACSRIYNLAAQPEYVREELRLDILPNGRRRRAPKTAPEQGPENSAAMARKDDAGLEMSSFMRTAIYLSDSITRARIEAATTANASYGTMFWFQLAIVGIGALTTILISVKSIVPGGANASSKSSFVIGIFAIIFSSIGTGTAALNSFYGPRESYFKSERALSALRQLHSDIASHVTSAADSQDPKKCPTLNPANKDDPRAKQLADWTAKLGSIVNATDSGSSSPSAQQEDNEPPSQ
jgi:hypothetical protein